MTFSQLGPRKLTIPSPDDTMSATDFSVQKDSSMFGVIIEEEKVPNELKHTLESPKIKSYKYAHSDSYKKMQTALASMK